jgi:hypothetical protein
MIRMWFMETMPHSFTFPFTAFFLSFSFSLSLSLFSLAYLFITVLSSYARIGKETGRENRNGRIERVSQGGVSEARHEP